MNNSYDVVIIGGGAIGAATSHFLKMLDPKLKVLLIEKRDGSGRGTTGAWGALLRVFSVRAEIAEKAVETVPYYLNFEENVGSSCGFVKTGSLYFFSSGHRAETVALLEKLKHQSRSPLELIEAEEGRVRFPDFQWWDGDFAVYEPDAGYACPLDTTSAWINQALNRGGMEVRMNVAVVGFQQESSGRVTGLELSDGSAIEAKRVLVCGGPWSQELVAPLGIRINAVPLPLQVNRFHSRNAKGGLPLFLDKDALTFARPAASGTLFGGFLVEREAEVGTFRQPLSLSEANEAKRRLSQRLKWLRTSELAGGVRAVEMYTHDFSPVLGFDENHRNIYMALGWCCSGFGLAPYYGKKIARDLSMSF